MLIERIEDLTYSVGSSHEEKKAIVNAIKYVIYSLDEELSTRTGFLKEEYEYVIEKIYNIERTTIIDEEQMTMIHQAFNEVCNGIVIDDFNREIGISISEAREILNLLDSSLNQNN